jgi:obg-like ATPase 1
MASKKQEPPAKKGVLGRVKSHLKMGIVGMPNVGKSSLFNLLTKAQAKASNFPFCTIEPNEARVPLPDERFNWLCELYRPKSMVSSYLEVWDIAGLVRGASEGEGLGNNFLSNIMSVDGIFHVIRIFEDADVTHVEGDIEPLRDLDIISTELRLKDMQLVDKTIQPIARMANSDPTKRAEVTMYEKFKDYMGTAKDIKDGEWSNKEIEVLNRLLFLTAKPVVYLINMSTEDYINKKNRWLGKIANWVKTNHPGTTMIPFSITLEEKLMQMNTPAEKEEYLKSLGDGVKSALDKITQAGFAALQLNNFFTCGADEVRAWPVQAGMKAPQAAGSIHGDFEEYFIKAEVMSFADLRELGSESLVKSNGKYRIEGKNYDVQDGDIMLIKHNAGGAKKK